MDTADERQDVASPDVAPPMDHEALLRALLFDRPPRHEQPAAYRALLAWAGSRQALATALGVSFGVVRERVAILTDPLLGPAWIAEELSWAEARALLTLRHPYRAEPLQTIRRRRQAGRPLSSADRQRVIASARTTQTRQRTSDQAQAQVLVGTLLEVPVDSPATGATYRALAALDVSHLWLATALGIPEATLRHRLRAAQRPEPPAPPPAPTKPSLRATRAAQTLYQQTLTRLQGLAPHIQEAPVRTTLAALRDAIDTLLASAESPNSDTVQAVLPGAAATAPTAGDTELREATPATADGTNNRNTI